MEHNGVPDMQSELDRMNAAIEAYAVQLDTINNAIEKIEQENQNDDVSRQIVEYQMACERDPANIAAEDALDAITRLQNTLKIVKRRNQLLAKENLTQKKLLDERSKLLLKETKACDELMDKTGWHDQYYADFEKEKTTAADVQEMRKLEEVVQKELRAAQAEMKRKEAFLRDLVDKRDKGLEIDDDLNDVYNDIRVKDRDCRELELQIKHLRACSEKNDEALTVFDSQKKSISLEYMETDKEYLKDAVAQMKAVCRRQDYVIRAQLTRQQQLQARLDTILKSLREMKLEKEYERNVSKSALVPSASREEPEDVSSILPVDETIPIHTYRLLFKSKEMLNASILRKNMLVLEKELVIQALEANLMRHASELNMTTKQMDDLKFNKDLEMSELMDELQQQHKNYLRQLEALIQENNQLKKKLFRHPPLRSTMRQH